MKTGRLLKFHRPGGDVQAYVYLDGGRFHAALYLFSAVSSHTNDPIHALQAPTEAEVEAAVRAWVDRHYPRG